MAQPSFARRSIYSGVDARSASAPPAGARPAHARSENPAVRPSQGLFGVPWDGKQKCWATAKSGSRCGAWAMPGTERCAGHTEKHE